MSKIAVVYWSGTGNTESMAYAVLEGISEKGGTPVLMTAGEFNASMMDDYDAIAFGCPAMGSEELEETEFAPMFEECLPKLNGKKIALFGSYSWADGEWMRTWEENCLNAGANLAHDCVICYDAPDDEGIANCNSLGASLV